MRQRSILQIPGSRRGPPNVSHTHVENNYQRIPVYNEADPANIPHPEKQNQSHEPSNKQHQYSNTAVE